MREARESFQGGAQLEESKVQFLMFADALVLVAEEEEEDTKRNVAVLSEVTAKWRIKINWVRPG